MTSYLSPQTRRTILAAQKDGIFPREATTLTDKLDYIVEEWRLIHEAADGALKRKAEAKHYTFCPYHRFYYETSLGCGGCLGQRDLRHD